MREAFKDIGVAARKGVIDGKEGWIAVQLFGWQRPNCTAPNEPLIQAINAEKQVLDELNLKTSTMFREIEWEKAQGFRTQAHVDEHNRKVQEYNQLVLSAKARRDACQQMIERYNYEASKYGECMNK